MNIWDRILAKIGLVRASRHQAEVDELQALHRRAVDVIGDLNLVAAKLDVDIVRYREQLDLTAASAAEFEKRAEHYRVQVETYEKAYGPLDVAKANANLSRVRSRIDEMLAA